MCESLRIKSVRIMFMFVAIPKVLINCNIVRARPEGVVLSSKV